MHGICRRLILLASLFTSAYAHSWVEQLMVIASNGTFVGSPGYPRGNVLRSSTSFSDTAMTYLLPPDGKTEVTETDNLCMDTQRKQVQTDGSPRLQASAGAAVALRFQENGHVTLPETQKGKPKNRGTIYVYGTTDPKLDEKLLDVHKVWTKEMEFPHEADQYMGGDLWCQADIALPSNAPSGKPYTLYWVWDWPTAAGIDPGLPNGKQEIYTTCMDVDVVDRSDSRTSKDAKYSHNQSLNGASIPEQFNEIFSSQSGGSSEATPTEPAAETPSSPLATAPGSATGRPVATVTVTSFVTSVQFVRPTGSA
ncbi:hypothetical protein BDW75DRAFT_81945 [Aspergillus navahoensis]